MTSTPDSANTSAAFGTHPFVIPVSSEVNSLPEASAQVESQINAIRGLHAELDSIVRRPVDANSCRQALLDCLIRSRHLGGGAWLQIGPHGVQVDVDRRPQVFSQRRDISKWMESLAQRAVSEGTDAVGQCPMLRSVSVVCVPIHSNRRVSNRRTGETEHDSPQGDSPVLTLILSQEHIENIDKEMLAAQCVVRAWRDWSSRQAIEASDRYLELNAATMDLSGQIQSAASLQEAEQTLVERLKEYFEVRFVAYAASNAKRRSGRLRAIAGVGEFDTNSQQTARIEAALNASLLHGSIVTYPMATQRLPSDFFTNLASNSEERISAPKDLSHEFLAHQDLAHQDLAHQDLAHKRLAEALGVESVVSLPVYSQEQIVGAILLGGQATRLLSPETNRSLHALTQPLGDALQLRRQLEGGRATRLLRRATRSLFKIRSWIFAVFACALIALLLIPVPYRVRGRSRLAPVSRTYCLAPYDGMLQTTFVEPGDVVSANQPLARMDSRELTWELAGLTAQAEQAFKQRDVYMADLEVADSLLSELEWEKLVAQKQVLQNKLNKLELRSPVDGVVIGGSLDRRENMPVTTGQVVFEIAPLSELRIEVAIPAEERPHVNAGMKVSIRIDGLASEEIYGTIERILPRSEIRDEQNVFIAIATTVNPDGDLKPGMEGSARITGGNHSIGWIVGHHAWERLMTGVWW